MHAVSSHDPSIIVQALRDGWVVPLARPLSGAHDPAALVERLARHGDAMLLESGRHHPATGRYSFLVLAPRLQIEGDGRGLRVRHGDGRIEPVTGAPWEALARLTAPYRSRRDAELPPFTGGWAGYLGYEARQWLERLPQRASDDLRLPWLHWGL